MFHFLVLLWMSRYDGMAFFAGCFASVVSQGMGQRLKVNVVEAHAITDEHVNLLNSTTVFYVWLYSDCADRANLLPPWLVCWVEAENSYFWEKVDARKVDYAVKWITLERWITARLIESTVGCG